MVVDWDTLAVSSGSSMKAVGSSLSLRIVTCAVGLPFLFFIWYVCRESFFKLFESEISLLKLIRVELNLDGERE